MSYSVCDCRFDGFSSHLTQRLRRVTTMKEKSDGEPTLKRVGIIGAGPSGLVAAKILKEKGIDVLIFEKMEKIEELISHRFLLNTTRSKSRPSSSLHSQISDLMRRMRIM